jgi:prepilin-type N-terminal cleavage/methylation domain-containing protein
MMKKGQKGFTLLELVVGVAIMAIVVGGIGSTMVTLLLNYDRVSGQNTVLPQIQSTGYWVSRDVQTARTVTPGPYQGFPITMSIPIDQEESNDYHVGYYLVNGTLTRKMFDSSMTLLYATHIADYIYNVDTAFVTVSGNTSFHQLTVSAKKDKEEVTRVYQVSQRLQ